MPSPTPPAVTLTDGENGLTYTQWHTTDVCSPTRSCFLTVRNHHHNGFGSIAEMGVGFPGYCGTFRPRTGPLPECSAVRAGTRIASAEPQRAGGRLRHGRLEERVAARAWTSIAGRRRRPASRRTGSRRCQTRTGSRTSASTADRALFRSLLAATGFRATLKRARRLNGKARSDDDKDHRRRRRRGPGPFARSHGAIGAGAHRTAGAYGSSSSSGSLSSP